jgi:hypothetical protein
VAGVAAVVRTVVVAVAVGSGISVFAALALALLPIIGVYIPAVFPTGL